MPGNPNAPDPLEGIDLAALPLAVRFNYEHNPYMAHQYEREFYAVTASVRETAAKLPNKERQEWRARHLAALAAIEERQSR